MSLWELGYFCVWASTGICLDLFLGLFFNLCEIKSLIAVSISKMTPKFESFAEFCSVLHDHIIAKFTQFCSVPIIESIQTV